MKKLLYMSAAMVLALTACDDDYNDQFNLDSSITDVKNGAFTLTDEDYALISTLPENQEKALAKDPEEKSYVIALENVGKKKYFNNMITAEEYIPAFIQNKYPNADNGSRFVITSNSYKEPSGYLNDFKDKEIGIYNLNSGDYKEVWGAYTHALYLSPSSVSKIPALLAKSVKGAAEGDMRVVNYAFSETEPSTGGDAPIIYKQVNEFDGEAANYVIAAKGSDGKYYPFGKLDKESYNYGYMKPAPITVENGIVSSEDAANQVVALEKTAKGFALRNGWNQYIYMNGNYDSFTMSSSIPSTGGDWSVKSNGDGTFSIVNVEKNKTVKLNYYEKDGKGSFSFGSYAEEKFAADTYYAGVNKENKQGGFKALDVTLPKGQNFVWKFEDGRYGTYWKASGHVGGKEGTDEVSESWLVSQQIDLAKAKAPQLSMEMVLNFLKDKKRSDYVNVYVSENYTDNVAAAKWNEVVVPAWPSGKNYDRVKSGNIDLSSYKGKKINLAFKYVSTNEAAPTWQISDIVIADLSKYWDVCLFKETLDDGTAKSRSYSRSSDVAANASALFVKKDDGWKEYKNSDAFVAVVEPAVYASVGKNEIKNHETVLPAYLKNKYPYAEEGTRAAVVYNKDANSPSVIEYTLTSGTWAATLPYETSELTFVKEEGSYLAQMSTYIDETFLGSEGGFVIQNVNLGGLNFVWKNDSRYGWKASAYANSKQNATDCWLVSPAINFKKAVAPEIVFDEALNKTNGSSRSNHAFVKVSTDYAGDVTTCTWDEIAIEGGAEGTSWDFVTVKPASLVKYVGQTIYVAFQYVSSDSAAPTWEIKNLKVVEHED